MKNTGPDRPAATPVAGCDVCVRVAMQLRLQRAVVVDLHRDASAVLRFAEEVADLLHVAIADVERDHRRGPA